MTDERFFPVLETHLLGAFYLTRAVYPAMVEQGYGRIVFTSSGTGAFGRPDGANYASAKAALLGLCNALAIDGAEHGILANAILPVAYTRLAGAPDITDTSDASRRRPRRGGIVTAPRMLPEWVTPMVVYLASEECTRTRHYYSAALGRFARVFIAATSGWYAPGDTPPTVEAIEAHLDVIENRDEFDLPDSVFDEIAKITERLPP